MGRSHGPNVERVVDSDERDPISGCLPIGAAPQRATAIDGDARETTEAERSRGLVGPLATTTGPVRRVRRKRT